MTFGLPKLTKVNNLSVVSSNVKQPVESSIQQPVAGSKIPAIGAGIKSSTVTNSKLPSTNYSGAAKPAQASLSYSSNLTSYNSGAKKIGTMTPSKKTLASRESSEPKLETKTINASADSNSTPSKPSLKYSSTPSKSAHTSTEHRINTNEAVYNVVLNDEDDVEIQLDDRAIEETDVEFQKFLNSDKLER